MEDVCETCGAKLALGNDLQQRCPECGSTFYRRNPVPTPSNMRMRNMPAPGEEDMGGNPLQEGILADGGWKGRMNRDESFASVNSRIAKVAGYDDWLEQPYQDHYDNELPEAEDIECPDCGTRMTEHPKNSDLAVCPNPKCRHEISIPDWLEDQKLAAEEAAAEARFGAEFEIENADVLAPEHDTWAGEDSNDPIIQAREQGLIDEETAQYLLDTGAKVSFGIGDIGNAIGDAAQWGGNAVADAASAGWDAGQTVGLIPENGSLGELLGTAAWLAPFGVGAALKGGLAAKGLASLASKSGIASKLAPAAESAAEGGAAGAAATKAGGLMSKVKAAKPYAQGYMIGQQGEKAVNAVNPMNGVQQYTPPPPPRTIQQMTHVLADKFEKHPTSDPIMHPDQKEHADGDNSAAWPHTDVNDIGGTFTGDPDLDKEFEDNIPVLIAYSLSDGSIRNDKDPKIQSFVQKLDANGLFDDDGDENEYINALEPLWDMLDKHLDDILSTKENKTVDEKEDEKPKKEQESAIGLGSQSHSIHAAMYDRFADDRSSTVPNLPATGTNPGHVPRPPQTPAAPQAPSPTPGTNACPRCGAPMSPGATSCPRCGSGVGTDQQVPQLGQQMPGQPLAKVAYDPAPYQTTPEHSIEPPAQPIPQSDYSTAKCPSCGYDMPPGSFVCPHCNQPAVARPPQQQQQVAKTGAPYYTDVPNDTGRDYTHFDSDFVQPMMIVNHPGHPLHGEMGNLSYGGGNINTDSGRTLVPTGQQGQYQVHDRISWGDKNKPYYMNGTYHGDIVNVEPANGPANGPGYGPTYQGRGDRGRDLSSDRGELTRLKRAKIAVDHQGPHNNEQFAVVAELLTSEGRQDEIPSMLAEPWNYAEELARAQNKKIKPPIDDTQTSAPPAPAQEEAPPGETMPVPGMEMPQQPMQASTKVGEVLFPPCKFCGEVAGFKNYPFARNALECNHCGAVQDATDLAGQFNTQGLDVMALPETQHPLGDHTGSEHAESILKEATPPVDHHEAENPIAAPAADQRSREDVREEQDTSLQWQDTNGEPLKVGQEYEMDSPGWSIPDIVQVKNVKPDGIVVEIQSEYGLNARTEIDKHEADIEQYEFTPSDATSIDQPIEDNLGTPDDQRQRTAPGEQSDLSTPHFMNSKTATPDSISPRCPKCKSGSTGLASEEGHVRCSACGNIWKVEVLKDPKVSKMFLHECPKGHRFGSLIRTASNLQCPECGSPLDPTTGLGKGVAEQGFENQDHPGATAFLPDDISPQQQTTPIQPQASIDDWEDIFADVKQGKYGDWQDLRRLAEQRILEYRENPQSEEGIGTDGIGTSDINHTIYGMIKSGEIPSIAEQDPQAHPDFYSQDPANPYRDDSLYSHTEAAAPGIITNEDIEKTDVCSVCNGTGLQQVSYLPEGEKKTCWSCDGSGKASDKHDPYPDSNPFSTKEAGAKYTPMEQREFVNEIGEARNRDKLQLDGTHYAEAEDDDFFLWGV